MRLQGVTGRAVVGCFLVAGIALAALTLAGNARAGAAAASGLVLGSVNGPLAGRALSAGMNPRLSGLARLALLSAAAIVIGVLIGLDHVWLVILGVGAAQLVLVGMAAGALLRR